MPTLRPRRPIRFVSGVLTRGLALAIALPCAAAPAQTTPARTTAHHETPAHPHHAARPVPTHNHPGAPAHAHAAHVHVVHARPVGHAPPPPAPAARAVPPVPVAPVLPPAPPKGSNTGLPLPRFASLRADDVNLRGGPGTRYPIQWVYKRRDLPVEIEREFDVWRLIEDSEGVKGWVHQATLVGTRSFVVRGGLQTAPASDAASPAAATRLTTQAPPASVVASDVDAAAVPPGSQTLRATPQADGALVAVLEPGVVGRIRSCDAGSGWCRVSVKNYSGWLRREAFWGLLPDETILPP